MRVAIITPQWTCTKGGPSRYVLNLSCTLKELGLRVLVLSGESGKGAAHYSGTPFRRELDILRYLKKFRPDVIHIHGRIHLIVPALIYKYLSIKRTRIVFTFHTQPYLRDYIDGAKRGKPDYAGLTRWVAMILLANCDEVTTVSRSIVDNLNNHCRMSIRPFTTIASGSEPRVVDHETKDKFRMSHNLSNAYPVLSSIGVFAWDWKVAGHLICLEALAELRTLYPRIRLLIAGDGAYRDYLQAAASRLRIEKSVIFLGNIDDVDTLLAVSDIYVHMAMNEGCPLAVVEAMMAGKPIVAARRGGIPEIIEDGATGILVEPNARAMGTAVRELLRDTKRQVELSRNSSLFAQGNLTWNVIARRYKDLYEYPTHGVRE